MSDSLREAICDVPDFPKEGIVFKDITPVLSNPRLLERAIEELARPWFQSGIELVAGIEARGFIFATAVARQLGCGFVPIRKPGKLPRPTFRETYDLEYGSDSLEMHRDAVNEGQHVLLIDDLLATGGTARAGLSLLRRCGALISGASFFIELEFLRGRDTLEDIRVETVLRY